MSIYWGQKIDINDDFFPSFVILALKLLGYDIFKPKHPSYHRVVIKGEQRFWKRILIVDDNEDVTTTFKTGIEDSNKYQCQ